MKLNFSIKKRVLSESDLLRKKIILYLKHNDYTLAKISDDFIKFKDVDRSTPASRSEYYTRVDEGRFEIIHDDDAIILKLSYKISILLELFALTALFLGGIYITPGMFVLYAAFTLNLVYKIYRIYTHTINDVLNTEVI